MHSKLQTLLFLFCCSFLWKSCSITRMLPTKAVISNSEIESLQKESSVFYPYGEKRCNIPVIPFQIFGVTYAQDIVLVSKHPEWNMHEFSRIDLPDGTSTWIAKDSRLPELDQYLTTSSKDLINWLPEIPLNKELKEMQVQVKEEGKFIDFEIKYQNFLGEDVEASFFGKKNPAKLKKRNGSTMGHSKRQVMAVLDLPARSFGKSAEISFDGKEYKLKKLLGIQAFDMVLTQTQGGLSRAMYTSEHTAEGLIMRVDTGEAAELLWQLEENENQLTLTHSNPYRKQSYVYMKNGEYLELSSAQTQSWNDDHATFKIEFFPPLPDFRFELRDTVSSKFVMHVNGQEGFAIGEAKVEQKGAGSSLHLQASEPWWVEERPFRSEMTYNGNGQVKVESRVE